jgi:hypothetical protein
MKKFESIIEKYTQKGVSIDNINYAISTVKDGIRREHALESLTADYRGVDFFLATDMLEDLYEANGGEFKKENKGGYYLATLFILLGGGAAWHVIHTLLYGGLLYLQVAALGGILLFVGIFLLIKTLRGKYRVDDAVTEEELR